jgi:hypothetical protein
MQPRYHSDIEQCNKSDRVIYFVGSMAVSCHRISNAFGWMSHMIFGAIPSEEFSKRHRAWTKGMRAALPDDAEFQSQLETLHKKITEIHHIRDALTHGGPSYDSDQDIVTCSLRPSKERYRQAYISHMKRMSPPNKVKSRMKAARILIKQGNSNLEISFSFDELAQIAQDAQSLNLDIMSLNRKAMQMPSWLPQT